MVPGPHKANGGAARRARVAGSSWVWGLLIVVLCALAQWPGTCSIPPIDRDESRFAQASRQVVEAVRAGDVDGMIVPRVGDRVRLNKPPLIYWVQGASGMVFDSPPPVGPGLASAGGAGTSELPTGRVWAYRLPSLVCAMLSALLTWRIGLAMRVHPTASLIAGAVMATCLVQLVDARQARADQLLLTVTLASQLLLWRVWDRRGRGRASWRTALALWAMVGLGVMTKGPITPMVCGLTALTLSVWGREWRWWWRLKPVVGLVVVAAMVVPWVVGVASVVGFGEYWSIVVDETVGRAGAAKESHWGPPGYHVVLLAVLLFPGSLMVAGGFVGVWRRVLMGPAWGAAGRRASNLAPFRWMALVTRRRGGRGWEAFCLAWIVPSWVVFEVSATKLPHYTLPLYPAVALIGARALVGLAARPERARGDVGLRVGMAVFVILGLCVLVVGPGALALWGGAPQVLIGLCAVLGLVGVCALELCRSRVVRAQWAAIAATVVAAFCTFGLVLPAHEQLWVSSRVVRAMESPPHSAGPVGAVGYREDSLVFLTRGRIEWVRRDDAAAWLAAHPGGSLAVQLREGDEAGEGARVVEGFNYSTGEWVRVEVVGGERLERGFTTEGTESTEGEER